MDQALDYILSVRFLSLAADIGSLIGLLVSVVAWLKVSALKKDYLRALAASDLVQKARLELAHIENVTKTATQLPQGFPIANLVVPGKKALVHIRSLMALVSLERASQLLEIQQKLEARPSVSAVAKIRGELDVLLTEAENVMENWKRT